MTEALDRMVGQARRHPKQEYFRVTRREVGLLRAEDKRLRDGIERIKNDLEALLSNPSDAR